MSRQTHYDWFASRRSRRPGRTTKRQRSPRNRQLRCEPLEDRRLLAITVDTLVDEADGSIVDGDISLRDAIAAAASGETIDFAASLEGGTLLLTQGELAISKSLDINGPGAELLTVDASGQSGRIFRVLPGASNVEIAGLTLTGGTADNFGGAIYSSASSSSSMILEDLIIHDNHSVLDGGAVYSIAGLVISDSTISSNSADRDGGGVMWINEGGEDLDINDSNFIANQAARSGGGIRVINIGTDSSAARITRSTFANNSASNGGGIRLDKGEESLSSIVAASTISGNHALTGGGIYSASVGAANVISESTITGNTATGDRGGGGLFWTGGTFIFDTIIAGNSGSGADLEPRFVTDANRIFFNDSLIGSNSTFFGGQFDPIGEAPVGSPDTDGNLVGGPIHGVIDPRLLPLADNGGSTLTHALTPLSPAFNAAGTTVIPGFDQRGAPFHRFALGALDIGAYEFDVEVPDSHLTVSVSADEFDGDLGPNDLSLREAIFLANLNPDTQTITFDPSIHGQAITLLEGELLIENDVMIEGPGAGLLTLVARDPTPTLNNSDGSRVFRIVDPSGIGPVVTISGLTLTNGDAGNFGGAIYADAGTLTVEDATLSDNFSPLLGGAIHMASGEVIVRNSRILGNSTSGSGGGIHSGGSATIEDSIIRENNAAGNGGGLDIGSATSGHTLTISGTTIEDNDAGQLGGGLFIQNTTMSSNIKSTTIADNQAGFNGGGIQTQGPLSLINSTISNNHAMSDGGGIVAAGAVASLIVGHSTITENQAGIGSDVGSGGGIFLFDGASLELDHTIVAENTDNGNGISPDLNANVPPVTVAHSLIGDSSGSGLSPTPNGPDFSGNLIGGVFVESSLVVSVDVAAMGDFEPTDVFNFEYSLDFGSWQPLFTSSVNEAGSQVYTLDSGTQQTWDDPLVMNGAQLTNAFTRLEATLPSNGENLRIRLVADHEDENGGGGGSEAFAWRNLQVDSRDASLSDTLIGRAVFDVFDPISSTFQDLDEFASHIQFEPDYSIPGDVFGIRSRGNPNGPGGSSGLPFAIADDSLTIFTGDQQGIVGEQDGARFFGVVDTVNGTGPDTNTAIWTFENVAVPIDPLLSPLADNGGPTLTHSLQPGSPAIDAGDLAITLPPQYDQRGTVFDRIVDGNSDSTPRIDIGAVELQTIDTLPFGLTVDTVTDEYDGDFSAGEVSLREAISFANFVGGADTIDFDPALAGSTISLLRGELDITDSLTIDGLGANLLAIDASGNDPTPDANNGDGSRVIDLSNSEIGDSFDFSGLTISGGDVSGDGGGILATRTLDLTEVHLFSNAATDYGGGIYSTEPLSIFRSTIGTNSAGDNGGGIYFSGFNDALLVEQSTVSRNSAGDEGGGLWSRTDLTGDGVGWLTSSTFSGNSAVNEGGGIRNWIGGLIIENSTITANTAAANQGSGISSYGLNDTSTELYSSIASGNFGTDIDSNPFNFNSFSSLGYNLIGTGNATVNFSNNDLTGVIDPKLGPLGDNGGPTFTHAALPGSPVVDAGDPNAANGPTTDQRGDARVADGDADTFGRIDVGAYELNVPGPNLTADFDLDGDVDGADFLRWQRGFGNASGASRTDGDADGNGAVNGADLAVWEAEHGQTSSTPSFNFTDQLVAYWPFDSDGLDASGNSLDLSLRGSATTAATGLFGNALTLDNPQPSNSSASVTSWAERPVDDDVFDLVDTDFTIQAWFNLNGTSGEQIALLDKLNGDGSAGSGGWTMNVFQTHNPAFPQGALHFYTGDGNFIDSIGASTISAGVWHQFIVRSDASGVDLIFDGVDIVSNSLRTEITAFTTQLYLGRKNPGDTRGLGLNGRIDETAIWTRSLSDAEVDALWNDGFGRPVINMAASVQQGVATSNSVEDSLAPPIVGLNGASLAAAIELTNNALDIESNRPQSHERPNYEGASRAAFQDFDTELPARAEPTEDFVLSDAEQSEDAEPWLTDEMLDLVFG